MLELAFADSESINIHWLKGNVDPDRAQPEDNRRSATLIMHERSPVPRRGQDQRRLTIGRELALCKTGGLLRQLTIRHDGFMDGRSRPLDACQAWRANTAS